MKCKHCGHENREGVKFCEECGKPISGKTSLVCPSCGHKNRRGVRFCEECGTSLVAGEDSESPEAPIEQPAAAPPPVFIEDQGPRKKQRLNPLWLLLLLLLLVTCCCCFLLLFEQVQVPDFIAPIVDPILHDIRDVLPDIPFLPKNDDGNDGRVDAPRPVTCEDFRDQLKAANLGQETMCYTNRNECYTDLTGIELYDGLEIDYQWEGDLRKQATCEKMANALRCYFPKNTQSDRVDYWISLDECEEKLGFSDGWLEDKKNDQVAEPPEPPLSNPPAACCANVTAKSVKYFRDPPEVGYLFLGFDLVCDQPWEVGDDCAEWDAWVGANRDIFWTSGSCCPDQENPNRLNCEGGIEDQKKSMTKIEMRYGDCSWEVEFQSPYYSGTLEEEGEDSSSDGCPPGESMCVGSCCTIGHCYDNGSGLGCW